MASEGLTTLDDFQRFGGDELKIAYKNTRSLADPISIPAKSDTHLLVASIAWNYYTDTGCTVTPTNMHYTNVLRDFHIEWKAIQSMVGSNSDQKLPVMSKNHPPLKGFESFKGYLYITFGVRKIPLAYIIRTNVNVPPEAAIAGHTIPAT